MTDPLILTAEFDAVAQHHFQAMRDAHFPPARNIVPAHTSLFHQLPGDDILNVRDAVADALDGHDGPFAARCTGLRFFGGGGAYVIECAELVAARATVAARFDGRLIPQDAQPYKPHVTYQNKVPGDRAKSVFALMERDFAPFDCTVTKLNLWWYRGGPWELEEAFLLA
ncbi:2'-5' RNA ligase family protein [Rhizobiaceae bacterium]|nr:2'-5' RNA ligase family protein [Rhizobiaceae bacterium]